MFSERAMAAMKESDIEVHFAGTVWRAKMIGNGWFQADGDTAEAAVLNLIDDPEYKAFKALPDGASRFVRNGITWVRVLVIDRSPLSDGGDGTEVFEANDVDAANWIRNMIANAEMDQPPFMVSMDVWALERLEALMAQDDL